MKTCDICKQPIVDEEGSTILDNPDSPILAHLKCWSAHEANIAVEFRNKIAMIENVNELRDLINNLPWFMRVHLKIGSKQGCTPTIGVEKYGDEYILEIRA
jgi:hypothetical protein